MPFLLAQSLLIMTPVLCNHITSMKTKLIKSSLLALAAFATLLLASCAAPSTTPTAAVSCDKCGTIHFKAPSSGYGPGNKGIVTLRDASRMSCPDCENQVIAMMKTGSLTKHVCKSCGGALRHCTQH
jgi:ribosomal protein S27E